MKTCNDCLHCNVCEKRTCSECQSSYCDECGIYSGYDGRASVENCTYFKDKSLVLNLPCKVCDTIYDISEFIEGTPAPEMYEIYVDCITIEKDVTGKTMFCIDGFEYYFEDFGKTVFFTDEAAEQALKEREQG